MESIFINTFDRSKLLLLAVILLASADAAAPPKKSAAAAAAASAETIPAQRSVGTAVAASPAAGSKAAANAGNKSAGNAAASAGNKAASSAAVGKSAESSRGASGNKSASNTAAAAPATGKGGEASRAATSGNKGAGSAAAAATGKSSDRAVGAANKGASGAQQSVRAPAASTKAASGGKSTEVDSAPPTTTVPVTIQLRSALNTANVAAAPDYNYPANADYNPNDDDDVISNRMFFLEDPADRGPAAYSARSSGASSSSGLSSSAAAAPAAESNRAAPADLASGLSSASVAAAAAPPTADAARSSSASFNAFQNAFYPDYPTGGGVSASDQTPDETLDYLVESLIPGDKVVRARAEAVAKFPGQRQVKAHAFAVADKPDQTADAVAIARGSMAGSAIQFSDNSGGSGSAFGGAHSEPRGSQGVRKIAKKIVNKLHRGEKRTNALEMLLRLLKNKKHKYADDSPYNSDYNDEYDEGDMGGLKYPYNKLRDPKRGNLGKISQKPKIPAAWGNIDYFDHDDNPFKIDDTFLPSIKLPQFQHKHGYVAKNKLIPHITYQLKELDELYRPQPPPEIITTYDDYFENPVIDPGKNKYPNFYNTPPRIRDPQQQQVAPILYSPQMYNNQPMGYGQMQPQESMYNFDGSVPPQLVPLPKPPSNDPFLPTDIFEDISVPPLSSNSQSSQQMSQKYPQAESHFDKPNFDNMGPFYPSNPPQHYGNAQTSMDGRYDEAQNNFDASSSPFHSGPVPLPPMQAMNSQPGQISMSNPRPSNNYWQSSSPFTNFLESYSKKKPY